MKSQRHGFALAIVLAAMQAPLAYAIDFAAGDWKFTVEGNVNVDYVYESCESSPVIVDGGLACVSSTSSSSVSNGLLPAALTFNGSTTQSGYDIGFTFGLYPGISTNNGGSPNLGEANPALQHTALGTAGLDIRQVFLTFGNDHMGTVMAGRNIGLFGADAILNDMTLLGVGAGNNGAYAAPTNTSLGSIGLGYIYTDWLAQINYTTPSFGGAKFTIGIFDPLNSAGQIPANKDVPGFHGKAAFTAGSLYLSASALYQKQRNTTCIATNPPGGTGNCVSGPAGNYDSYAFDFGGKYAIAGFEFAGWYYFGDGVGTTGLFVSSNDVAGNARRSEGFLAQATYTIGPTKLGINYGQSRLGRTSFEFANLLNVTSTLVEKNDKFTVGAYYNLTKNLMLLTEYTYTEATNQADGKNKSSTFNVGAFLKF
jgi:predicted porin